MATASGELLGNNFRLVGERIVFPFGSWWEAEDEQGARALILRLHAQVSDPAAAVKRVIDRAAKVDSPHIVGWVDGGLDAAGHAWLAAPMLGPWTFAEHVTRTEGIEPAESGILMHQLARGMATAEAAGLVHHALNSEFVRVVPLPDGTNSIKIYGYGLADVLPPYKPLRKQDAYVGVPDYMSPEMCGGKAVDGSSADVYAAGILMYEAVRGRPPFAPTFASASASTTLKRHIFEKPLPLHVRYASTRFIKPYEAISFKALNKTANRRHVSLAELEQELADFVTDEMQLQLVSLEAVGARAPQTARRSRTQILEAVGGSVSVALTGAQPFEAETTSPVAAAPEAVAVAPERVKEAAAPVAVTPEPEIDDEPDEEVATIVVAEPSIVVGSAAAEQATVDSEADEDDVEEEAAPQSTEAPAPRTQMFRGLAAQAQSILGPDEDSGDDSSESEAEDSDTQERSSGGARGGKGKKGRKSTRKSRRPTIDASAAAAEVNTVTVETLPAERRRTSAAPTVMMAAATKPSTTTEDEERQSAAAASTESAPRPRVSGKLAEKADEPKARPVEDEQDAWFSAEEAVVAAPAKKKNPALFLLLMIVVLGAIVVAIVLATTSGSGPETPIQPAPEGPKYGSAKPASNVPAPAPAPALGADVTTGAANDATGPEVQGAAVPAEAPDVAAAVAPVPEPVVAEEPKPEPVVAPTPEPKPEPVVEPKPEPVVAPKPEPVVAPKPAPVVAPKPEPKPEPKPAPVVAPKPEPKPAPVVVAPKPEPTDSPEAQFKKDAAKYMELGLAAYKKDNYKLAVGYFSKALSADPTHALASRYLQQAKDKLEQ